MKKALMIISILAIFLVSADPVHLIRLTLINKANIDMAVQLHGEDEEEFYYLTVPEGRTGSPTERTFTIVEDTYLMQVFYLETWDPVYGFQCETPAPSKLEANISMKIVFKECGFRPPNKGERSMEKYYNWRIPLLPKRMLFKEYLFK